MRQPMQYVDGLGRDIPGPLFPIVDAYTTLRAVLLAKCKFERKMERKSSPHRIHLSVAQLFFSSAKIFAGYMIYLLIGAGIFIWFESKNEEQQCQDAKQALILKTTSFGNMYFYELGMNLKICGGIKKMMSNQTELDFYRDDIVEAYQYWHSMDCSESAYFDIIDMIMHKDNDFGKQHEHVFKNLMMKANFHAKFDEDVFTLSGATLRTILKRTADFSISNYMALQRDCEKKWNFHNAFFFAGTIATTIGYGNLAPVTEGGKIFCIIFVTIGIPYFGYMMSKLAENSNVIVLKIGKAAEKKLKRGLPASLGTTLFSLMGFFFLIVGPVHLFYHMEGWDVLDSVYFIFISLSTTGFGDMVPRNIPPIDKAHNVMDEDACLNELTNPMPSSEVSKESGISVVCDKTTWPHATEAMFNMYRIAVFFWLILGLLWLGSLIRMVSTYMQIKGKKGEQLLKSNIDDTKKKLNIEPQTGMNFLNLAKGRLDEGELRKSALVQKAVVKWKCLLHKHDETGGCMDKREVVIEFDEENEISVNSQVINDDLLQNHSPLSAQKIVLSHL